MTPSAEDHTGEDQFGPFIVEHNEKIRKKAGKEVLNDLWKFCLINGTEEHGNLIGTPNDPFFTLKLLKRIVEMRNNYR